MSKSESQKRELFTIDDDCLKKRNLKNTKAERHSVKQSLHTIDWKEFDEESFENRFMQQCG